MKSILNSSYSCPGLVYKQTDPSLQSHSRKQQAKLLPILLPLSKPIITNSTMDESVINKTRIQVPGSLVHLYNYHHYFFKRTLLFLVTLSVFSFFVCLSSGFSMLPNSFYVYFNTCLFSFLTHTLERKYMFLICNGILAFLAKTSSNHYSVSPNSLPAFDAHVSLPTLTILDEEEERKGERADFLNEEHEDSNKRKMKKEEQKKEKEKEEDNKGDEDGDGDQGEGSEELASTEELNRRIEEFIRKMKEEIRIEAQQQLITV